MKTSVEIFCMTLALSSCVAASLWGQQLGEDLRVEALEPGLWLVESDSDWNGTTISANALIVVADQQVLVVDTPWTEDQTTRLLDWIEREIGLPVRHYVVTHAHSDRMGGIAEVHRRAIPTLGHEGTVELARTREFEPPQITFSQSLEIDLGAEVVALLHPGPGHAPDNIVVWLPQRQLLYGGCFIKHTGSKTLGYVGDADLEVWPKSLTEMQRLVAEPRAVIPGHGERGGPELIAHTRMLLESRRSEETSPD